MLNELFTSPIIYTAWFLSCMGILTNIWNLKRPKYETSLEAYGAGSKDKGISVNPNTTVFIKEKEWSHKMYRCFILNALRTVESFFFLTFILLLFIFGSVGSLLPCVGFSLVAASGGYSSLWCAGFSLWWLLLLRSTGSRCAGFSSCGTQAQ